MLRAMKPKNCMKKSVRYAPTRRDAKRAAKSAIPQHTAPVNPRITPKEFSTAPTALDFVYDSRITLRACDYFQLFTNGAAIYVLAAGQGRPLLSASLSRLHSSRSDCATDTRDDRWRSVSSRGNRTTRRENRRCPGWFATVCEGRSFRGRKLPSA